MDLLRQTRLSSCSGPRMLSVRTCSQDFATAAVSVNLRVSCMSGNSVAIPSKHRLFAQRQHRQAHDRHSRRCCRTLAAYHPYPFNEDEYLRASLSLVIQAGSPETQSGPPQGTLILTKVGGEPEPDARERALVLFVGGDTLSALSQLVQGFPSKRPMALDLLWKVLERGQEITEASGNKSKWRLVHMAIVALEDSVYLGRLFFGDLDSGEIVWDCDCRPSDGLWLAMKSNAPIFVRRAVWAECATEVQAEGGASLEDALRGFKPIRFGSSPEAELASSPTRIETIVASDPEPIKRLKREMQVAIGEEDYKQAQRIKEHPWMQIYAQAFEARQRKDVQVAQLLERELRSTIAEHERRQEEESRKRGNT